MIANCSLKNFLEPSQVFSGQFIISLPGKQ